MNTNVTHGHRSVDVAQYILDYCAKNDINPSLTPMQLLKLVYIAHGWVLGLMGKPLISDKIEAWKFGPVIPSLYRTIKGYRSNPVPSVSGASSPDFDAGERSIVDQVCAIYGKYDGLFLSSLTHQTGSPWEETWDASQRGCEISNDIIESHYRNLKATADTSN